MSGGGWSGAPRKISEILVARRGPCLRSVWWDLSCKIPSHSGGLGFYHARGYFNSRFNSDACKTLSPGWELKLGATMVFKIMNT